MREVSLNWLNDWLSKEKIIIIIFVRTVKEILRSWDVALAHWAIITLLHNNKNVTLFTLEIQMQASSIHLSLKKESRKIALK